MIEILPLMWITSTENLTNQFIKNKNVKNIINCSKMKKISTNSNIEILDFPIHKNNLMKANFDIILEYIYKNIKSNMINNKSIVIYCLDGETYSPFIALLYIIRYGNIPRITAIQLLQDKMRKSIYLDLDLDYFLKKYY